MLRITAITAVGATRRAVQLSLQQQCPTHMIRSYSTADSSFSIHTPKAAKSHRKPQATSSKQRTTPAPRTSQRSSPSSSSRSSRSTRVLALANKHAVSTADSVDPRLLTLQKAIDSQDLASVWLAWQEAGPATRKLGRTEHRKLQQLCSSYLGDVRDASQKQRWREPVFAFASAASLTGDVDLTCNWLRQLLADHQFDQVISIWEQIVAARFESGPIRTPIDNDMEALTAEETSSDRFVRLDVSTDGERVDIQDLVSLVAFACTKTSKSSDLVVDLFDRVDFGSPFRLFFNMSRTKRLFDSVQLPVSDWKAIQATLWIVELARGLSSGSGGPQRIARLLGSLFQMRQVDEAYRIFETAMRAATQAPAWLSLEKSDESSPPRLILKERSGQKAAGPSVCPTSSPPVLPISP